MSEHTQDSPTQGVSRRSFLAGGGALVIGVGLAGCLPGEPKRPRLSTSAENDLDPLFAPDAFVRIAEDDTVTVVMKHIEFGQGPYTGLTTLVAEELDASWAQMRVEAAPADDERYKNLYMGVQGTGGSTSLANSYYQMRNAGAAARTMLVDAAAERWKVPASEIEVRDGVVQHAPSGRSSGFGALAELASKQALPEDPKLKTADQFVFIGREMPRIDTAEKSNGTAKFTIDAYRDGMLTVVIAHPPKFGAQLVRFDASRALEVPGVEQVQEVPSGVAVYAENTYSAIEGRKVLEIEWDESAAETRSSEELFALFSETAKTPGRLATGRGDAPAALEENAKRNGVHRVQVEYRFPYLAHATMEPLDALIENDPEAGEGNDRAVLVTMGSQGPGRDRPAIADALGISVEDVRIDNQLAGGSFGRRSQMDSSFSREASHVFAAQAGENASRRPTKLLWTREDDLQGGYYRPMVVHRIDGAIDDAGQILGWDHTIAAQSFVTGTPMEARMKGGIDPTVVEGVSDLAYQTDHLRVTQQLVEVGIPTLWWRSVGHTHTGFAVEAFIDELLERADVDAVEGRLALLGEHPRHQAVLERAAEMANWGSAIQEGRSLGVAVHKSFGTVVAQIAEIERRSEPDRPHVRRVWCAVDCGIAVNPNVIRAQMEGGIGFGLGPTLYSEIQIAPGGAVLERNFDRYRNLRIHEMPEVEVAIIASDVDPTGVGEPGVPPIAPAVANAWRRLTGNRVSRLPIVRTS